MNIFKVSYLPWRYFPNWFKNIGLFFRRFKWAWQRATRGYSDWDLWDLDQFYVKLFKDSLWALSEITHGWPANNDFPEFEDWTNYLKDISRLFDMSREEYIYENKLNPYYDEYMSTLKADDFLNSPHSEIRDKYFEEQERLDIKRIEYRNEAFEKMLKYFDALWD